MTAARTYSLREIESQLGLSSAVVRRLIAAGFVSPTRGPRNALRFTFQDMVLLRAASELQAASIPPRKIVRALSRLKASLPAELPLAGLRINAVGSEVVVREGGGARHAETGQWLIDFEVRETRQGNVAFLVDRGGKRGATEPAPAASAESATAAFERAVALEASDARGAERAYRHALALDPRLADAWLNLGVLLSAEKRFADAAQLYREGLRHCPREPLLHFNLGVALDDLGRTDEALASYEQAIALDAQLADAHFNAARLYEAAGQASRAIRHYSAYRRLQRS